MSSPQPVAGYYMQQHLAARAQQSSLQRIPSLPPRSANSTAHSPLPFSSSSHASSFTKLYSAHKQQLQSTRTKAQAIDAAVSVYQTVQSHQTMLYGTLALFFASCGAASLAFSKLFWDALEAKRHKQKDLLVLHGVEIPEDSLLNNAHVQRVIQFAALGHQGQRRKSGHLYVVHCIETALIAEKLLSPKESLDRRALAITAAILHDINDTCLSLNMVAQSFGEPVAKLVDTVTRVSQLNQLTRRYKRNKLHAECKATEDELRNLLLNSVDDPLVLLIKLADRLHNMRSAYVLEPAKQTALAEETMNIWCPLAERLGLFPLKAELEDLCFAILHQQEYADIRTQLDELWGLDESVRLADDSSSRPVEVHVGDILDEGFQFDEDVAAPVPDVVAPVLTHKQRSVQSLLTSVVPFDQTRFSTENGAAYLGGTDRGLGALLECSRALHRELLMRGQVIGHNIKVQGRLKSLYSIYRKMKRKGMTHVADVYDARALRVIVDDANGQQQYEATSSCYRLEGVVARLWKPLHAEADDYIANPKASGYQSLHTAVLGPDALPMEVQIRTETMHNAAEYGSAAHWHYKETTRAPSGKKQRSRTIPVGYPLWRVDGHSLNDGVVVDVDKDGSHLLVAIRCGSWSDSSAASPDTYHDILRQVDERGYFEAGQGDLQIYLERYVRCSDNRFHRVDTFGHKHNTFVVPLHNMYEIMKREGTALPIMSDSSESSGSSSSESGDGLSSCPSLSAGIGSLEPFRVTPSELVAAAMREAEHSSTPAAAATGAFDISLSHLGVLPQPPVVTTASLKLTDTVQATRAHSLADSYVSVGSIVGAVVPDRLQAVPSASQAELDHEQHSQRVNVLRQTLEARIGLDDEGSQSLRQSNKDVLVMVWPTGEVRKVDHGTTAGHIIQTQGEIMIDTEGRARRRKKLVNVNNKLVPESTPLQSGDYVVLTRDLLDI